MIGRKVVYVAVILGVYTFLTVFSIRINFTEVFIPTIFVFFISYGWFLYTTSLYGPMLIDYKDVVINIFVYSFISFFISFIALAFSGSRFEPIRVVLLISPIMVWVIIWRDAYFQKMKGKF